MPQDIVIVGAGFAGTWSALAARRLICSQLKDNPTATSIRVTVIAPEPQLVLRPRLYEADPARMVAPLADLFQVTGVRFVQGTVENISVSEKAVHIVGPNDERSVQPYDRLIFAAGSCLLRPKIPGLQEHTFNVDQLGDAIELEAHLHSLASRPSTVARNTIVVCGAGFTGIEVATELPSRLKTILGDVDSNVVKIVLVTQADEVGDTLGSGPRSNIAHALRQLGVEVKVGVTVNTIDAGGVTFTSGERIETSTTIWAAGVAVTPLAKQLPGERDALGRLLVDAYLRLPSNKEVLVAGDAACAATDNAGNHSMMSCQHAMPLGKAAGHNAAADLLHIAAMPYAQPSYVTCLDLGAYGAVLTNGWERKVVLSGAVAKKIKSYINTTLISAPEADLAKALAAANPGLPSVASQNLLTAMLSFIAFFTSRIF